MMEPVENYFEIISKELTFVSNDKMSLPVKPLTVKIYSSKMQHCFCNIRLSMSIKGSPGSVSQHIKIMKPGEQCNSLCDTALD